MVDVSRPTQDLGLIARWRYVLRTTNPPEGRVDIVSKWLVLTRAAVLRQVTENEGFLSAKRNEMFVMMEYFGYLRRDPDVDGYAFWLRKLNQFGGNFEQAEMVKAFIVSGEYRDRFPQ